MGSSRREFFRLGVGGAVAGVAGWSAAPGQTLPLRATDPVRVQGKRHWPGEEANPLSARIAAFTTVSPDVEASILFYRDVIGMTVYSDGPLSQNISSAPGVGQPGRRQVLLHMPESSRSAAVRVLEAPANAPPIRPRPNSDAKDPGLFVMEGGTRDPMESYHVLASAGVTTLTPPRYYASRGTGFGIDLDAMSYSPIGPAGEQILISANVRNDRPEPNYPGLHSGFYNTAIVSLDQRPVEAFYENALGLKQVAQGELAQRNSSELVGLPADTYYTSTVYGRGVSIEVWEIKARTGTVYPTSLEKTGLAMLTIQVNDLERCRRMCAIAGIEAVGPGALPLPGNSAPSGFVLRGAVGELIEVVQGAAA